MQRQCSSVLLLAYWLAGICKTNSWKESAERIVFRRREPRRREGTEIISLPLSNLPPLAGIDQFHNSTLISNLIMVEDTEITIGD